jgi:nicotinamidase-related amidase
LLKEEMSMASGVRFGPLGPKSIHLCVDMQTLFAKRTDWHVPWLERVLPAVTRLSEMRRECTVFTRFVPPERPEDAVGAWRRYYAHWRHMTGERLDPRLIQLVPPLAWRRGSGCRTIADGAQQRQCLRGLWLPRSKQPPKVIEHLERAGLDPSGGGS